MPETTQPTPVTKPVRDRSPVPGIALFLSLIVYGIPPLYSL